MNEQLQNTNYKKSTYERPNQKWVCGKKSTGNPCLKGPGTQGQCQVDFECSPRQKDGKWVCALPQSLGGPCSPGPSTDGTCGKPVTKCQPVRSRRNLRGIVTGVVVMLTFVIVALILTIDGSKKVILPGALSAGHAVQKECSTCHSSFNNGFSGWVTSVFSDDIGKENSNRCQSCHDLNDHAMSPHSLPEERMKVIVKLRAEQKAGQGSVTQMHDGIGMNLSVSISKLLTSDSPDLNCNLCHKEHRGARHDITKISQESCQVCHQNQFYRLSNGHPEFVNYPNSRRTRIIFDHVSHLEKHFKNDKYSAKAPLGCQDCHFPNTVGTKMLVTEYEYSCAVCHQSQVSGCDLARSKGVEVFGVPGLDFIVLQEEGIDIGEWPEFAEDELSPFMKLLLSVRPEFSKIDEVIGGLDLLDLTYATDEQLEQVKNLAWIVKELFYELETKGATALMENFRDSLNSELRNITLIRLAGALPPDLIQSARQNWFPGLLREIPLYRSGASLQTTDPKSQIDEQYTPGSETSDDDITNESGDSEVILESDNEDYEFTEEELTANNSPADENYKDRCDDLPEETGGHVSSHEERASSGGWYRDDYQLRYRPVVHADQFMKTWLDVSSQSSTAHGFRLFEFLVRKNTPGACIKCHSIDKTTEKRLIVNWKIPVTDPNEHAFTKFSHTSHYSLLDEKGCFTCHKINKEVDYTAAFDSRDCHDFASNYQPISKKTCAECHIPDQAGDSCITCHNYHIGNFPPAKIHPKTFANNING
ncbi:MAG: cytochrome c3 family protein [Candidatus Scalindua sp.]|nr:cytochrome c3 family protein [Candidatus Scalindua sp.]